MNADKSSVDKSSVDKSSVDKSDIRRRILAIDSARRQFIERYNTTEYIPKLRIVQKDCESTGHAPGRYWNNGFGWEWWYCGFCGAIFDKQEINLP